MRHVFLALALFGVAAASAAAQAPVSLDTPVKNFRMPRTLPECGLEALLGRLAKDMRVSIGFERTTQCRGHQPVGFPEAHKPLDLASAEVLDGVPVKDVLARIAALVPHYDWAIMDGVAVFRPSEAWKDAHAALGAHVPAVRVSEAPLSRALAAILDRPGMGSANDRRPKIVSVDFQGGIMLEALNALVREQPAMWYVSSDGERLFLDVWHIADASGISVAMPIRTLFDRRIPSS